MIERSEITDRQRDRNWIVDDFRRYGNQNRPRSTSRSRSGRGVRP
jgi:hypothetical protein